MHKVVLLLVIIALVPSANGQITAAGLGSTSSINPFLPPSAERNTSIDNVFGANPCDCTSNGVSGGVNTTKSG